MPTTKTIRTIKTLQKQSLLDIAVEHCGGVAAAVDIAALNNVSLTAMPPAHTVLVVPDIIAPLVVQHFKAKNWHPATGFAAPLTQIEVSTLSIDFAVSPD